MRVKVEQLAMRLADSLSGRAGLECVTVGETAENDILDPYFSLILDAYFRGPLPAMEERLRIYGKVDHFETDAKGSKDRFFLDDVPIHVNLNSVEDVDALIEGRGTLDALVRESGTHRLYRICHCRVLVSSGDWHARVGASLLGLGDPFWNGLAAAYCEKMDHFLSDLGASTLRGDEYFTLVSTAEFLRYAVSALFALNRRFEPSHRFVDKGLRNLASLPENFLGRWEGLLRSDGGFAPERKYEIAKLLAKSLFNLL